MGFLEWLGELSTLDLVLWSIAIGASIATVMSYYNRVVLGSFVRTLIDSGALSVNAAMTLEETGFAGKSLIKRELLSGNGLLSKIVFEAGDKVGIASEGHSYSVREGRPDLRTAKFYIPEENRVMAELRFEKKGTDLFGVVLTVVMLFVLAYVLSLLIPYLIENLMN